MRCRHLVYGSASYIYNITSYIIIIVTNQREVGSGQHICSTTYRSQCPQHSYDVYVFTNLSLDVVGSCEV